MKIHSSHRIKAVCRDKQLKITHLHKMLDLSQNTFYNRLNNETWNIQDINRLLDILGTKYEDLFLNN